MRLSVGPALRSRASNVASHTTLRISDGSFQVCVRVRPFLPIEPGVSLQSDVVEDALQSCVSMSADSVGIEDCLQGPNRAITKFQFNKCFWSVSEPHDNYASQETIYNEIGCQMREDLMNGRFSNCLLHGACGTGKTYTSIGRGQKEECGLIPRVARDLVQKIEPSLKSGRMNFQMSIMEIHMESMRDLLIDPLKVIGTKSLELKSHPQFGASVVGLHQVSIKSEVDVMNTLATACKRRTTEKASYGLHSRSHLICYLHVDVTDKGPTALYSKVCFADLASGSRHDDKAATREVNAINKSLSVLARVISDMSSSIKPPFRDCRLTHVLQECLTGTSKTVVMTTVSPCYRDYQATSKSLQFAKSIGKLNQEVVMPRSPSKMKRMSTSRLALEIPGDPQSDPSTPPECSQITISVQNDEAFIKDNVEHIDKSISSPSIVWATSTPQSNPSTPPECSQIAISVQNDEDLIKDNVEHIDESISSPSGASATSALVSHLCTSTRASKRTSTLEYQVPSCTCADKSTPCDPLICRVMTVRDDQDLGSLYISDVLTSAETHAKADELTREFHMAQKRVKMELLRSGILGIEAEVYLGFVAKNDDVPTNLLLVKVSEIGGKGKCQWFEYKSGDWRELMNLGSLEAYCDSQAPSKFEVGAQPRDDAQASRGGSLIQPNDVSRTLLEELKKELAELESRLKVEEAEARYLPSVRDDLAKAVQEFEAAQLQLKKQNEALDVTAKLRIWRSTVPENGKFSAWIADGYDHFIEAFESIE